MPGMSLFQELKRRNVFRVGIAYSVGAWLLLQLTEVLSELLSLPGSVGPAVVAVVVIGFPVVLFAAWAYELTPEGIKRESEVEADGSITRQTGRRLDRAITVLLVVALGYFLADKYLWRSATSISDNPGTSETTPDPAGGDVEPDPLPLPDDRSLAVLPLENLGDEQDDAFAAGIHGGLLTELAQISSLRVVSRSSVARFAGSEHSLREIASLLNVNKVLEGDVQRMGDQLRVSLQLVDAATDAYLWAETFNRELTATNVFAIQDEIAQAVARALKTTLSAAEMARLNVLPTDDLGALELYYRGTALMEQRGEENLQKARDLFRQAREKDPAFAQALAAEAQSILLLSYGPYGSLPREETLALARPLVETALELAPDNALALAAMGNVLQYEFRNAEAVQWFRRSLAINPADGEVINWLTNELSFTGEWSEIRMLTRQAVLVDPTSRLVLANAARLLSSYADNDPAEIEQLVQRLERLDPTWAWYVRGGIAKDHGDLVKALRCYQQALSLDPGFAMARAYMALSLAELGLEAEAVAMESNVKEATLAVRAANWQRALTLSQAEFEASPRDVVAVADLARALTGAGRWQEAVRLGLIIWETMGSNPHRWPASDLANMAWGGRITERPAVRDEFAKMTHLKLDPIQASGLMRLEAEIGAAKLAALEGRLAEGVAHLAAAIDLGYRSRYELDRETFEPLADQLGFREQVKRMDRLIAEERAQALALLCGPGGILAGHDPEAGACSAG
jgi:TolB-like protein